MLPMTINQQRSSKMQAVVQPEVMAIQKKYKNKKDQASMMKQQEEIQQVYDKYGVSMMADASVTDPDAVPVRIVSGHLQYF